MAQYLFTITAGRTGTAWLADFLSLNQKVSCVHEPLGVDDFGVVMPSIRLMRTFNHYGNNAFVQSFWRHKLEMAANEEVYSETNHTLAKCGLVENLALSDLAQNATLIMLKRDIVKQCVSYLVRNDFGNITLAWQWYLHPAYPRKLVNPQPFLNAGQFGLALWYCYEMLARQEFYKQKYSEKLRIVEVMLEDIITPEGANELWQTLGGVGECRLPPPKNQNTINPPAELVQHVQRAVSSINFDAAVLVSNEMDAGFSFDAVD